jgi:hypothetical protein
MRKSKNAFVPTQRQTNRYREVVRVLGELADAEGLDVSMRAYSEAIWSRLYEELRERYGAPGSASVAKFLGLRGGKSAQVPAGDHVKVWRKKGAPVTLTSEPYEVDVEGMRALVAFCDAHGLSATLTAGSVHFPSHCLLVVLQHKGEGEEHHWPGALHPRRP